MPNYDRLLKHNRDRKSKVVTMADLQEGIDAGIRARNNQIGQAAGTSINERWGLRALDLTN